MNVVIWFDVPDTANEVAGKMAKKVESARRPSHLERKMRNTRL